MGCRIRWANEEKTIVECEFDRTWTWPDFYDLVKEQHVMFDTVDHPVHTILYTTSEAMVVPAGALANLRHLISMRHPVEDQVVISRAPTLIKMLLNILQKTYGVRDIVERFHYVDSLEEAHALLAEFERSREKA